MSALVYGVVRSADAGWGDPATIGGLLAGLVLVALFVANQRRAAQPLMPLPLFASRRRLRRRFMFNGVLLSFFFFMTQYLQGVSGDSPLQAGLAFLPVTAAAFAAPGLTPRLTRRRAHGARQLLADRVSASLTAATVFSCWHSLSRCSPVPAGRPRHRRPLGRAGAADDRKPGPSSRRDTTKCSAPA